MTRMIILGDENLKKHMFLTWPYQIIASSQGKQQNEETCTGYSQMFSLMTVRWTVHEVHIYSIKQKK